MLIFDAIFYACAAGLIVGALYFVLAWCGDYIAFALLAAVMVFLVVQVLPPGLIPTH